MNARMPLLLRRGACPGLSAPMPTGDGLLVRFMLADAMPTDAFDALCAAARAHGNGTMEVTARGSLQVRGLTPSSAPLFAAEVAGLGIAAADGVSVLAGPLRDDADGIIEGCGLAADLRRAIARAHLALSPKVSVVVDGGGGSLHLDALSADVRLRAVGPASAPRLLVAVSARLPPAEMPSDLHISAESCGTAPLLPLPACGERVGVRGPFHDSERKNLALRFAARPPHPARKRAPTSPRKRGEVLASRTAALPPPPQEGGGSSSTAWLGAIALEHAADVVVGLLREIAALGPAARGPDVIGAQGIDALRSRFGIEPAEAPAPRPPAEMVGQHPLRDGSLTLGVALAFGHAQADALAELGRLAVAHGARSIRPAPDRALMLIGVPPGNASSLADAAEQLGFVVSAADPRRRIAACPGAPACASGFIDARRIAAALAPHLAGLRSGIAVHVSGCAKGCAHPVPAALTVVGDAHGCGIVRNGTARAPPRRHVAPAGLTAVVACVFAHSEAAHG